MNGLQCCVYTGVDLSDTIRMEAMSKQKESKLIFKALLPSSVKMKLHRAEEGGYWAKCLEIPCYAQGETLSELFDVLTRAIYAYFDVPEKLIGELGSYVPVESVRQSVSEAKPSGYTLDEILNQPESIRELQRV